MDFARKQLEKYGWTDGKGLGKNENGMSQALKPKLKRSVTGIGHDPASEFNEHWWNALYDKAASNIQVKEKNGQTKKIKTKDDFKITNNTWQINRNSKHETNEPYSDYFVRKSVLSNGGSRMENVKDSDSEGEHQAKDVFKMTDEELFAACEGRTAHKGARHGLKALGKLARIAQQEEMLLTQEKYSGYSHSKKKKAKIAVVEEVTLDTVDVIVHKKKEKRKSCINNINENIQDNFVHDEMTEAQDLPLAEELKRNGSVTSDIKDERVRRKSKKSVLDKGVLDINEYSADVNESDAKTMRKKKRKLENNEAETECMEVYDMQSKVDPSITVKKKKKKKIKMSN